MQELRFDGRVAVITGGGRGIGREIALLLAGRGARVVVNNRSPGPADAVATEIRAAGGEAVAQSSDVGNDAGARAVVEAALDHFGRIDIVVNNAGIITFKPFEDISVAERDELFAVHINGSWSVSQAAWPHLLTQRHGRIINIVSSAGLWGAGSSAHYCVAKGALVGLTKGLANEGEAHDIRVNALAVGGDTRMTLDNVPDPAYQDWARRAVPAWAAAVPVAWLAHERCDVTGEVFGACGRWTSRIFTGNTEGYAPGDAFTPEGIRDHADAIMRTDTFEVYQSAADHSLAIARRVREPFGADARFEQQLGRRTDM